MIQFIDEIKNLSLPDNRYVLCGDAPLAARELKINTVLDILVDSSIFDTLVKRFGADILPNGDRVISVGNLRVYDDWPAIQSPVEVFAESEFMDNLRIMSLRHWMKWKRWRLQTQSNGGETTVKSEDAQDLNTVLRYAMKLQEIDEQSLADGTVDENATFTEGLK